MSDPFLENVSCLICPKERCSQPSNPANEDIKRILNNNPIAFTENLGQVKNDNVRFYVQNGGLWFTDDGVWIEVRDELSVNSQQSTVYSPEYRPTTND